MKIVKNYLLAEELVEIIDVLKQHDSAIEREIIKFGMIAQYCIDEFIENKDNLDCGEIYNLLVKDENIYEDLMLSIKNFHTIDYVFEQERSIYNLIDSFIVDLTERVDKMVENGNGLNLEQAILKLQELSDKNEYIQKS